MAIINPASPDRSKRKRKPLGAKRLGAERLLPDSFVPPGSCQSDPLLIISEAAPEGQREITSKPAAPSTTLCKSAAPRTSVRHYRPSRKESTTSPRGAGDRCEWQHDSNGSTICPQRAQAQHAITPSAVDLFSRDLDSMRWEWVFLKSYWFETTMRQRFQEKRGWMFPHLFPCPQLLSQNFYPLTMGPDSS